MNKNNLFFLCLLCFLLAFSEARPGNTDTLNLEEVVVSARRSPAVYSEIARVVNVIGRDEIVALPAQSLDGLLEYAPGVDIRKRGALGVQSDVSIRGGSFDQALVLVNGIKINDPQTGHHNLNIPVDPMDIERIEVLAGPGSRVFGANAFSGAINIITSTDLDNSVSAGVTAGEYGFLNARVALAQGNDNTSNFLSYNYKISDGYIENTDFDINNIFWHGSTTQSSVKFDYQAGYQKKAFGANSFYSPAFPEQFENTRTKFASIKAETGGKINITPVVYWRRHHDRFELFRYESEPWYEGHNYHQTDVYGAELNASMHSSIGKTAVGFEFRSENILSNVLGEPTGDSLRVRGEPYGWFTHAKSRDNLGLFAEHTVYFDRLIISAGAFSHYNSDFGTQWYPGIDIVYYVNDNLQWFSSYNHSMRLPTFTDLYYEGPSNTGNPALIPERAATAETGIKFLNPLFFGHVSVFHRDASNVIDWVKRDGSLMWESENITVVEAYGLESQVNIPLKKVFGEDQPINNLKLSYNYTYSDKDAGEFISNYALDFLKHKFISRINHDIIYNLSGSWMLSYRERNGNYFDYQDQEIVPYEGFWLLDIKFQYKYNNIYSFVEISNVFDRYYIDFGNIRQPGRWVRAGINYRLDF